MTKQQAIQNKWFGVPTSKSEADIFISTRPLCLCCGSDLLVALVRPPIDAWRVHCNYCGSEVPIAVMLNNDAWRITAQIK